MGEKKLRAKLNIERGFVKQKGCERYEKDTCLIFDLSVPECRSQAVLAAAVTPAASVKFNEATKDNSVGFFALVLKRGGAGFVAAAFKDFAAMSSEIRQFLASIGLNVERHEVVMRIYGGEDVGVAVQRALKVESTGGVDTLAFDSREVGLPPFGIV